MHVHLFELNLHDHGAETALKYVGTMECMGAI